jgi:hypothetical protein
VKSSARMIIAAAALVFGLPVVIALPAAAYINGCSSGYGQLTGVSYCSSGTGTHRVIVSCESASGQNNYTGYGSWRSAGQYSTFSCGYRARSASVQTAG